MVSERVYPRPVALALHHHLQDVWRWTASYGCSPDRQCTFDLLGVYSQLRLLVVLYGKRLGVSQWSSRTLIVASTLTIFFKTVTRHRGKELSKCLQSISLAVATRPCSATLFCNNETRQSNTIAEEELLKLRWVRSKYLNHHCVVRCDILCRHLCCSDGQICAELNHLFNLSLSSDSTWWRFRLHHPPPTKPFVLHFYFPVNKMTQLWTTAEWKPT